MSLKSKIEAVIYASEEPVTLAQLVVLLSEEVQAELDALAARQSSLPLDGVGEDAAPPAAEAVPVEEDTLPESETDTAPESAEAASAEEPQSSGAATGVDAAVPDEAATLGDAASLSPEAEKRLSRERERAIRDYLRTVVDALMRDYADSDRGLEIREVAGGFRFGTKPEYHDAVRGFVKSLKPAMKLTLQALETLAVVAYKQPVTAAEISEIRGVDSAGVLGGLLTRKLIQTAGRKQVIGRPMLYKTTKEFLVRFGLRDVQELPSMEEFERMAGELSEQEDLPMEGAGEIIERANARGDAEHIREANESNLDEVAERAGGADDEAATQVSQGTPPEGSAEERSQQQDSADASPLSEAETPSTSLSEQAQQEPS